MPSFQVEKPLVAPVPETAESNPSTALSSAISKLRLESRELSRTDGPDALNSSHIREDEIQSEEFGKERAVLVIEQYLLEHVEEYRKLVKLREQVSRMKLLSTVESGQMTLTVTGMEQSGRRYILREATSQC